MYTRSRYPRQYINQRTMHKSPALAAIVLLAKVTWLMLKLYISFFLLLFKLLEYILRFILWLFKLFYESLCIGLEKLSQTNIHTTPILNIQHVEQNAAEFLSQQLNAKVHDFKLHKEQYILLKASVEHIGIYQTTIRCKVKKLENGKFINTIIYVNDVEASKMIVQQMI